MSNQTGGRNAAAGRPRSRLGLLLAAAATALVFSSRPVEPPQPLPDVPPGAPDLLDVFAGGGPDAALHARQAACLFDAFADRLEYDGRLPEPRIRTGAQAEDFRVLLRDYQLQGLEFSRRYPRFGSVVGDYLDRQVGTSGGTLDRPKWLEAYRSLAGSAAAAAARL